MTFGNNIGVRINNIAWHGEKYFSDEDYGAIIVEFNNEKL